MRILLLSQWFAPEPAARAGALAEELSVRGHSVTVVTGFPNYPQGRLYPGYKMRPWSWEDRGRFRVLRLALYPDHSRSALKRLLHYLSFWATSMTLGPWLCGRADAVWAFTMHAGLPGVWLRWLRRFPFVLDVADVWPETLSETGMLRPGLLMRAAGAYCRLVYRNAGFLTVQSHGFRDNLIGKGVPAEKIIVVENMADDAIYHPQEPDPEFGREHGLLGRFNVIFAGAMGLAQGLPTLIQAASKLTDRADVQFVLVGEGACIAEAKGMARRMGLDNVRFVPHQPASDMPKFFAHAGALLVHLKRSPLFSITVPAKTQVYLASGKPVIMAVAGEGARLIAENGCGLACPPEDPDALAAAVRELRGMNPEQRAALGRAGHALYLRRFTKQAMVDRMESVLAAAAEGRAWAEPA
jgi:glycosyltransferase involved in cell wall biosynthesis